MSISDSRSLQDKLSGQTASWEQLSGPDTGVQAGAQPDSGAVEVPTSYRSMGESYADISDFEVNRESTTLD
ncbi:hypothetical protein SD70_09785 [Gordoniibacillus kamchatkensis]|uniref:Uncharacterized protein n=1 Tax=Gordoniibacillus kamchatkensis TaxID=1590651 RepID=A0ABR5AJH6_9BACL|nr:hypothetical protein [Paenibacillus sp. VKM B-2647]KIL41077.1 hypothetical protein SD70_09785 [Paenibacillus sp. VKM B-2647]